ncbi:hypothetical protein HDU86_001905 [Geranomyces michiganensis]|nr:hypothetical protein HDU86_001905 [Geranomyces michiganensis]
MAVVNSPPPQCLLKAGPLSLKRTALPPTKRFVVLCAPLSTTDIRAVFSFAFKADPLGTLEHKQHLAWLGNIACAAVKGTPLLIILGADGGAGGGNAVAPVFVQFSDIRAISDETQLRSACNFALHVDVKPYDYKFAAASSTDYQQWNAAFGRAMSVLTDRTMGELRGGANDEQLLSADDGGEDIHHNHRRRRTGSSQSGILFDFESATNNNSNSTSRNGMAIPSVASSSSSSAGAGAAAALYYSSSSYSKEKEFKKLSTSSSAASSPPTSPIQQQQQHRAKKVPVLADRVAPPSLSRKYTLGNDQQQQQQQQPLSTSALSVSSSSAASSPRPRSAGSAHSASATTPPTTPVVAVATPLPTSLPTSPTPSSLSTTDTVPALPEH